MKVTKISAVTLPISDMKKSVDFYSANLTNADLSGADLTKALLASANLSGANLQDANLSDVFIDENTNLNCKNHPICLND